MKTITIDRLKCEIPSTWNEFSDEELVFLSIVMSGPVTPDAVKLKMLLFMIKASVNKYETARDGIRYHINIAGKSYFLSALQMSDMAHALDWLFKENTDGSPVLDVRLTRNPFPVIETKMGFIAGPEDALSNITYGQFIMLQSYQQMLNTEDGVYKFLATIYKKDKFNTSEEGSPEVIKLVRPDILRVLIWYYIGSMEFIREKFPNVFSGGESGSGSVFDNQMRVVDALAGGDVTKKDQVKSAYLYDALYTLEIGIENERKAKSHV